MTARAGSTAPWPSLGASLRALHLDAARVRRVCASADPAHHPQQPDPHLTGVPPQIRDELGAREKRPREFFTHGLIRVLSKRPDRVPERFVRTPTPNDIVVIALSDVPDIWFRRCFDQKLARERDHALRVQRSLDRNAGVLDIGCDKNRPRVDRASNEPQRRCSPS